MDTARIKHLAAQMLDPSGGAWVGQFAGMVIASASSFVMPIKHYLLIIGALVVVDMYTGWRAAKKLRGERFNSKGMGGTIEKTVLYMLAILICRGCDLSFGLDGMLGTTYIVAGLITGRELLSNLENIGKVTGLDLATKVREAFGHLLTRKNSSDADPQP
jgi:hypothetical protein